MKVIKRKCTVCGKALIISLDEKRYSGGYYYGKIYLPAGKGEWAKIGSSKISGKKTEVVLWTGQEKEVEYWECGQCHRK